MIPVLILAAGQSSRMNGRDKLLEDVAGKPLLRRQIERADGIGPIYVALPRANHPRMSALIGTHATPMIVPAASQGMGATMRDAVRLLPRGDFMMVLADLISIKNNDLRCIIQAKIDTPDALIWRGATASGKAGHPIIFHQSLRPRFDDLSGDSGGESLVKPLEDQTVLVKFDDERARYDLDTPQDWEAWRRDQSSRSNNSAS